MTRRLPEHDRGRPVRLVLDGEPVRGFTGENIAVALLASEAGVLTRSLKYHRPRGFFCLEGHCGSCLMRIGGVPNLRACMVPCSDDLRIEGQNAYPSPAFDVLGVVDWMFPGGMDQHTLMTGSRLMNSVVNKVVRQLAGLGVIPEGGPSELPEIEVRRPDVVVVGGGPAGLAAAERAAKDGAETLLVDEHDAVGGSLLADPRHGRAVAAERAFRAQNAGAELWTGATALGFYPEDDGGLLAVAKQDGLCRVFARSHVYATGGYAQNRPFTNNDRPGVLAARAVGRMLCRYGVKPAERICVLGDDDYAISLAGALADAGCEVYRVDGYSDRVLAARGRTWVSGVDVETEDGKRRRIACDLVAVSAPPAPASEAPRQHGCAVELRPDDGGFVVVTEEDGRTAVEGVFACGDVCGYLGPERAAEAGARAGAAAAKAAREDGA